MSKRKTRTALIFSRQNQRFKSAQNIKPRIENIVNILKVKSLEKGRMPTSSLNESKELPRKNRLQEKGWNELLLLFKIKSTEQMNLSSCKKLFETISAHKFRLASITNAKIYIESRKTHNLQYNIEEFFSNEFHLYFNRRNIK